ncbi:hypothetical protein PFISCL1PPCAC_21503 [Pristionchus fissidentatus]|uniref:Uncharacterized protein n=1 Tax=Pristionchus fissidentatus TaxID=1538716 RepID=A0AAV5WE65_9BILA|nr:hypothetical protein PFISCL1PPCAC_21503 [Pristionchus fissidentatus]
MAVVESIIQSLEKWRQLVGGDGHGADEASSHPFLRSLYQSREKIAAEMEKIDEEGEEKRAYREDSRQYSVMCREMHSLLKVCGKVGSLVGGERWKEQEDLDLMSTHIGSAIKSTHTFLEESLIRFGSLMDVMGGYWNAVWIVHVSLNTIHHEMTQHSTRLSLISTTAFPRHLESPAVSWLGPLRHSLVEWAIRATSPLSLDLQSALVEWKVAKGETGLVELEWTRNQWQKWYEKHGAKADAKEFEYKEKSMEEKEEIEMEEMFSGLSGMDGVMGEEALVTLLEAFTEKKKEEEEERAFDGGRKRLVAAIAYLNSLSSECGVKEKWKNAGLDASLFAFTALERADGSVMDVYRETSRVQMKVAIEECERLKEKTEELREKWPEIQSLSLIIDAIESLMDSSLSIGQMRMAEKLEKIIEESEEWEKLADRAHSLEAVLSPLRERLVEWKKMEILCWNRLVHRVKKDCEETAALVAYPLFEVLLKEDSSDESIVAMAADWISHASLIDFNQRLRSVQCLAAWAHVVNKCVVEEKLLRVVGYFGQFRAKVNAALKDIVDPIERLMKDLVRIAQYKDLNILSIKASSKKNHAQLFKMVRRLKNEGGAQMSSLMDVTIDIEGWRRVEGEKEGMEENGEGEDGRVKRARELSREIIEKRGEALDCQAWIEMGETIDTVRKECEARIEYSGEEKEMESQQGRERNSRQRAVALVIKESQIVGVNSRRGMTLNEEEISRRALTDINPLVDKRRNVVRALGLARSILIRRGMKPNQQLSTSTRGHFLGMVEYGCHYAIENEGRIDGWKRIEKEMERLEGCMRNEVENGEEMDGGFNHGDVKDSAEMIKSQWNQLDQVIRSMKMRLTTVPATVPEEADESWSPLSRLSSSSTDELAQVSKIVEDVNNLSERILHQLTTVADSGVCGVYSRSTVTSASAVIVELVTEWMGRMEAVKNWFDEESDVMRGILEKMQSAIKVNMLVESEGEVFSLPTQSVLLFIQRLYKSSVERGEEWQMKEIDRLSKSATTLGEARPEELCKGSSLMVLKTTIDYNLWRRKICWA